MNMRPVVLVVLDGWGIRDESEHNAIAEAKTPFFDDLWKKYPHSVLDASAGAVGLPVGQMGNSEVGHMTIGAGRVLKTDLMRINQAIETGEFAKNPVFLQLFDHVKKRKSTLHLMGLVSAGGVHSHQDHLHAFLKLAKEAGVAELAIHAFTDGRDTHPQSAHQYLADLENIIEGLGIGFIATATGRFYAMDRDKNWERLAKAEAAIFRGEGRVIEAKKPSQAIGLLHSEGMLDEHLEPIVFLDDNGRGYPVRAHDAILNFNYRADRARQITESMVKQSQGQDLLLATLTEYDENLPVLVAFPPVRALTTIAKEVSRAGLSQAHVAETEKYAHATYFLNGGVEEKYPGEEHVLVESRKDVATHDLAPEMRASEIADEALARLEQGTDFIFVNIANADMVGHTGNKRAIITAVEAADRALARIVKKTLEKRGVVLVTADHGNAEQNIDESGAMHTAHTTNKVPAIITIPDGTMRNGGLADVAPTVLDLLGLPVPDSMTGKSLLS